MAGAGRSVARFAAAAVVAAAAAAASILWTPRGRGSPADPLEAEIRVLEAKLAGDPGLYPVRAQLGAAYLRRARARGDFADLRRAERELLASLGTQETQEALRWLAAVRLDQHRFAEAEALARRALDAWDKDGIARAVLGDALLACGEIDAARRAYEGQADFYSLAGHARCLFEAGEADEALAELRAALAALDRETGGPEARGARAWCHRMIGSWLFELGREAESLAEYEAALRLDPRSVETREHRAEWEARYGSRDAAVRLYGEILREVERPELLASLGALEGEGGAARLERAEEIWRARLAAGDVSVRRALALHLLDHGGDAAEALRLAREDLGTRRDALAYDTLAWALFRNGEVEQARALLEGPLRHGPPLRILASHRAAITGHARR